MLPTRGGEAACEGKGRVLRAFVGVEGAGGAHLAASPDRHVRSFERELNRARCRNSIVMLRPRSRTRE
jgi:hypothetical protein